MSPFKELLRAGILAHLLVAVHSLQRPVLQGTLHRSAVTRAVASGALLGLLRRGEPAAAADEALAKRRGLSASDIAAVVEEDITARQFLVSGRLTRSIYDEACTFTDAIDKYTLDKWIKGTGALFLAEKSHVDIVPGTLTATTTEVRFRFDETLCFNLPLLKPIVPLTGELVLTRDRESGLITSYLEKWDTGVAETLAKAYL